MEAAITKENGAKYDAERVRAEVDDMDDHQIVATLRGLVKSDMSPVKLLMAMMVVLEPEASLGAMHEIKRRNAT